MTDSSLKQAILEELAWEPRVDPADIAVAVRDGMVTLTGQVGSYTEKWAAEHAAGRVAGVKAVTQALVVRCPFTRRESDGDIAERALRVLSWDIDIPQSAVTVEVENGYVTLSGDLDWHYQRNAAEADVRKLHGVVGVTNDIRIRPRIQAADLREKITAALRRNALIEADHVTVATDGGKVTLGGRVRTWAERSLAASTAWSAPGITQVEDRIAVG